MKRERRYIDITHMPELVHLVEEAQSSGESLVLRRNSEDVAVMTPLHSETRAATTSDDEMQALLSSAGGWKGLVDGEQLKEQLKAERGSNRSAITL